MYGYAGSSATATQLTPFTQPQSTTNPAWSVGPAGMGGPAVSERKGHLPHGPVPAMSARAKTKKSTSVAKRRQVEHRRWIAQLRQLAIRSCHSPVAGFAAVSAISVSVLSMSSQPR